MKTRILITLSILFLSINLKAQDGLEAILLAGKDDASKLTKAYVNPAMKGLIYSMNGGWYHTAKVHKKFGFDITIGANLASIPTKDEVFSFANLGLSTVSSSPGTSPTVAGGEVPNGDEVEITIPAGTLKDQSGATINEEISATFRMPDGIKDDLPLNAVPAPVVQFNIGLPYKIDAMLRLVPKVGSDDVKGELLGLGIKKEITSWFGPLDKLPLHVSLLGAYTNMKVTYDLQNDSSISGSGQEAEFKLNSYTIQAIASLNFPIINVYAGIGYGGGTSDLNLKGTYNLDYTNATGTTISTEPLVNPLNASFSANGFSTTIGTRLSLGFFKIFADYTLREYNTISGGIAFSFR